MTGEPMDTDALVKDLHVRFSRVERAILGDPTVGHIGLVDRVENLEGHALGAPALHQKIDDRRIEGDRRLHDRLDSFEDETHEQLNSLKEETREKLISIEKKLDRAIWLTLGAFIGGGVIGGGSVWAVIGGG